ncbi:hypothetical protein GCM10010387_19930 [Streptomyces inusitatus]|uniref:Lipoprotein n=1 Tax=Streptomyces inusitatus TaxID=68221 RepID=A0A918PZJ0_9ACTN|nr:hypothetical protein [Streptomyces inusitatus]GGZ26614.1 hypothetical protein GCM10010387_19930 [Streptomyces inusitatus]
MFSGTISKRPMTLVVVAAVAATLGLSGCSVDASKAEPESKTFAYDGKELKLKTNEVATKVVAVDREDIKVTRWFDAAVGSERLKWTLEGDTLDIDAGCSGIAICDAKFKVEIPQGIALIKDGKKTDLSGKN